MSPTSANKSASKARSIAILMEPERLGMPLYAQLYRQLREHILNGSLEPGSSLPSARVLAADLQISRNTVESAISQLRAEGFVTRRIGSGTVVTDMSDAAPFLRGSRPGHPGPMRAASTLRAPRSITATADSMLAVDEVAPISKRGRTLVSGGTVEIESDLQTGFCTTDLSRFPIATWNRIVARVARDGGAAMLQSGDLQGDHALRQAISEHARLTRGLRCSAHQVLIVSSTQQALDLSARLLLAEGDTVLVEEPGYRSARATFAACGSVVRGVPVDAFGVQPERLADHERAKLLYLTPSHQFPLGVTLTLHRRLSVLAWARSTGCWIIEDDYDSEFRYDGRPVAAMQGLDRAERVLYVGTFNKVLFPSVRVAYLIVPRALVELFVGARRLTDGGAPTLVQAALAEFVTQGHFAAHLRRSRRFYESQRNLLVDYLRQQCGDAIAVGASETGLHLVGHLASTVDDEAVAKAGARSGLGLAPLSHYYAESREGLTVPRGLLFGFGGASEDGIRAGVNAIAARLQKAKA